jgi:hypothetical protein
MELPKDTVMLVVVKRLIMDASYLYNFVFVAL